jgi:hypothetical protein
MADAPLQIELVPRTAWYKNVRSEVSKERWDELRRACYRKAGYVCEICGGKGPKWPVECHEVWGYDDDAHKQTLVRLIALCPMCHATKHFGLSQIRGIEDDVIQHMMKVNRWSKEKAYAHVVRAMHEWSDRSEHEWKCDISWLDEQAESSHPF